MSKKTKTHNRLDALFVSKIAQPGKYADGRGLYLLVDKTQAGSLSKRWAFRYRVNGRERWMGLGPVTRDNGLKEARDQADTHRKERRDHRDPIETRKTERIASR